LWQYRLQLWIARRAVALAVVMAAAIAAVMAVEMASRTYMDADAAQTIAEGGIVITDPMGMQWHIQGAEKLVAPVAEQLDRMNRIENEENRQRWPDCLEE